MRKEKDVVCRRRFRERAKRWEWRLRGARYIKQIQSYLFPAPKMLKKIHGCAFLFDSNGATLSCDTSPSSLPGCDGRDSYNHGGRSAYRFDRVSPMDIHKEVFQ